MPQKYLSIDGVATLVHHRGPTTLPGSPPDLSTGRSVVCCHDAGVDGTRFGPLLDALAEGHSPMAYDQPGHGRSAGLDSLGSIDGLVGHLRGIGTAWSLDGPVLVGEGLGAAMAVQAATEAPDWPSALVLVGDVGASYDVDAEIEQLSAITAGKARREFDRSGYAPDTERPVYQQAFAAWVKTDPRATLGDRRAQAAWSLASPPAVPTLIVTGAHQPEAEVARAADLIGHLPAATHETLAGAGRHGVLEQPAALAALIDRFLADAANGGQR
ncbi:MAG: alpha/beta hydrolase [Actinomycetota bacterium]